MKFEESDRDKDAHFFFCEFTLSLSGEELLSLWRGISLLNMLSASGIISNGISEAQRNSYESVHYFLDALTEVIAHNTDLTLRKKFKNEHNKR